LPKPGVENPDGSSTTSFLMESGKREISKLTLLHLFWKKQVEERRSVLEKEIVLLLSEADGLSTRGIFFKSRFLLKERSILLLRV
jgi:hypothetical protein